MLVITKEDKNVPPNSTTLQLEPKEDNRLVAFKLLFHKKEDLLSPHNKRQPKEQPPKGLIYHRLYPLQIRLRKDIHVKGR